MINDEDKALFRALMKEVKPLKKSKKQTLPTPKPLIKVRPPILEEKVSAPSPYLSDTLQDTVLSEEILSYCQSGLNRQRFKELKQGRIPWVSRLDLHGLNSDTAKERLIHFIHEQYEQHHRCLLLIHGKGGHQGAPPLIKNLVNRWLTQFEEVLAFHSALPKDGGSGALYVLLKRQKEALR